MIAEGRPLNESRHDLDSARRAAGRATTPPYMRLTQHRLADALELEKDQVRDVRCARRTQRRASSSASRARLG